MVDLDPPLWIDRTLRAVSADAASDVWAVGDDAQGHALVLHGNGTSWATSSVPVTRAAQLLQGVRAFSPSDVLTGGPIPIQRTLAQRWNGTSWIPQVSANSGTTDNLLEAASRVPGASFVWAVGFRLTSANVDQTLIERGAS